MKLLLYSIFLTTLSFCSNSKKKAPIIDYSGFQEKKIVIAGLNENFEQKDTLATLMINIPQRLNTFYQWEHVSDCRICGFLKYRFADGHYPKFLESGFIQEGQPDSTNQLTIQHKPFSESPDSMDLGPIPERFLNIIVDQSLSEISNDTDNIRYRIKEFILINERPFAIFACLSNNGYLTRKPALLLMAITNLKSRQLSFIAECSAKDTTDFVNNMYKAILSIKINEK